MNINDFQGTIPDGPLDQPASLHFWLEDLDEEEPIEEEEEEDENKN